MRRAPRPVPQLDRPPDPADQSEQSRTNLGDSIGIIKALLKSCRRENAAHADVLKGKPHAGVIPEPKGSERHQAAREHGMHALRHLYASVLLDAGENIKALSQYLGHSDPGFTLRVYTHLMPSSEGRTRRAVDKIYEAAESQPDGPQTAQRQ
ncbi:tyrosine-type recombinase/integrase [Sphaerisporangium sp. NPDC088356]|uniref:tyrosine-type recombinase/integrase n=1 Tax=Sphaerisporangium sp. NPDC088356 TaxID=3154871 RepID=UPI003432D8CC